MQKCMGLYLFPKNIIRHIQYSKNTYDIGNCIRSVSIDFFFLVFVCGLNVNKGRTIRKVIGGWGFVLHEFCFGQVRSGNCI